MEIGEGYIPSPIYGESEESMITITDIIMDIQRGIAVHNMVETEFSYRGVYFVNFENGSEKHYIDTRYDGLRITLENIIRGNLSTTNTIVVAAVTTRKSGEIIYLLSRSYAFSLSEYFQKICEEKEKEYKTVNYGRRKVQWC